MNRRNATLKITFGLSLLVPVLLAETAPAQVTGPQGFLETFPMLPNGKPGFSKQSGLQVTVDATWLGNKGYRPVRVTLRSPKPTTSETLVTVVLRAGTWGVSDGRISVEQDFRLPQGATEATATLLMPQYIYWHFMWQEIWIDGKKDEELCAVQNNFTGTFQSGSTTGVMIVAGKEDRLAFASMFDSETVDPRTSSTQISSMTWKSSELPQSWLAYSSLSVVATTPGELKKCADTNPKGLAALLDWVRSGGNLWVFDGGKQWQRVPEVQRTLGLPVASKQLNSEASGWRFISLAQRASQREDSLLNLVAPPSVEPMDGMVSKGANRNVKAENAVDSRPWFVARAFGFGIVTVFRHDAKTGWFNKNSPLSAIEESQIGWRLDWAHRHGNDPESGNPDFYNLLVQGVGQAPVIEFQLLISLFVLAIGPVNYWLLKRRRKLPMLLVTVPTAAAISTLLLFAYGLLVDGFESRVRARSFTLIDQRKGEAACWGRLSYYAGLSPKEGLRMPADTAIYPILPHWDYDYSYSNRFAMQRRTMEWKKDQRLTKGWLSARSPTQYQTVTVRPTNHKLLLKKTETGMRVTNRLGVEVLALGILDHEGDLYFSTNLPADETVQLPLSDDTKIRTHLRKIITDNLPTMPPGADAGQSFAYQDVWLKNSLLEIHLDTLLMPKMQDWSPGTYLAITAQGAELPLGVENANEEASLHVIRGTW